MPKKPLTNNFFPLMCSFLYTQEKRVLHCTGPPLLPRSLHIVHLQKCYSKMNDGRFDLCRVKDTNSTKGVLLVPS